MSGAGFRLILDSALVVAVAGFMHAMRGMQADLKYSISLWVQSAYGLHATAASPPLSNAPSASTQTGAVGCRESW